MLDIRTAVLQGTHLLEAGAIAAPRLTAEVLLCHALRCERSYLYAHPEQELSEAGWIHYGRYLHERLKGKPTQYITKRQEFYGRDFRVTPDVLIPRPETEHLVEAAIKRIRDGAFVLDIGTGSGAIAVTLALETNARVFGCDRSPAALRVAERNRAALCAQVEWFVGDLAEAAAPRSLDVVVSNPPYVPETDREGLQREVRDWEPSIALYGGPKGYEFYERIIAQARCLLCPGGWLLFELGYRSLDAVLPMLDGPWSNIEVIPDLAGLPRVLVAKLQS